MSYRLRDSIRGNKKGDDELDVMSSYREAGVWDKAKVRPPKMIVGVSVTSPLERKTGTREFPEGVWTFPAVLDTGCTSSLEIDETHLEQWAGLRKEYLDIIQKKIGYDGRPFERRRADVWVHSTPYKQPKSSLYKHPLWLEKSSFINVMDHDGERPWPRLPVLGLGALTRNGLHLQVDTRRGRFVIARRGPIWPLTL